MRYMALLNTYHTIMCALTANKAAERKSRAEAAVELLWLGLRLKQ